MHRLAELAKWFALSAVAFWSSGCQTWHSGQIAGMSLDKKQREVLSRVERDPFPSPRDVGMQSSSLE